MDFSLDGEQVSHSPRTEPHPESQLPNPFVKPSRQTAAQPPSEQQSQSQQSQSQQAQQSAPPQGCGKFVSLAFYQQFFQVSQQQVLERIKLNFIPIKREFFEKTKQNPDFYGPFWILTTIIFLLGSTSNLARYFANWQKTEYILKLELVRYGVIMVYSIGFGVPALLHLVLKFLKCTTLSLPDLICIYGYSFGCFILVFLLCIIPYSWLQWLLMIYGMVNSIAFLVLNLMEYLQQIQKKALIVYGIIGGVQIFLFLMYKLVFFDLIYDE